MNHEYLAADNPEVESQVRSFNWAIVVTVAVCVAFWAGLFWVFAKVFVCPRGL